MRQRRFLVALLNFPPTLQGVTNRWCCLPERLCLNVNLWCRISLANQAQHMAFAEGGLIWESFVKPSLVAVLFATRFPTDPSFSGVRVILVVHKCLPTWIVHWGTCRQRSACMYLRANFASAEHNLDLLWHVSKNVARCGCCCRS